MARWIAFWDQSRVIKRFDADDALASWYDSFENENLAWLPDGTWVLYQTPRRGAFTDSCQFLREEEVVDWLLIRGHEPPAVLQPLVASRTIGTGRASSTGSKDVRQYDPICEPDQYDFWGEPVYYKHEWLHSYPGHRWILIWESEHVETGILSGKQHKPLTEAEAAEWFLGHALEVPKDLFDYLPDPPTDTSPSDVPEVNGPGESADKATDSQNDAPPRMDHEESNARAMQPAEADPMLVREGKPEWTGAIDWDVGSASAIEQHAWLETESPCPILSASRQTPPLADLPLTPPQSPSEEPVMAVEPEDPRKRPPARSAVVNDDGSPQQAIDVQTQTPPLSPIQYLLSWREILDALDLKNNAENQRRVRQLNAQFEGPIALPGRGKQPKVSKDKLLSWWNGLEERFQEIEQKQVDTQATLQSQHDYGRDGEVLPAISGHVKKRRGKKSGP